MREAQNCVLPFLILLFFPLICFAQAEEGIFPGPHVVGRMFPVAPAAGNLTNVSAGEWEYGYSDLDGLTIQAHLTPLGEPVGDFEIEILNENYKSVQRIPSHLLGQRGLWTGSVVGSKIVLRVASGAKPSFRVDQLIIETKSASPESIIGYDQLVDVKKYSGGFSSVLTRVMNAVGKLSFVVDGTGYTCTAFLIAADQAMTNDHCVNSQPVCETATLTFGYEFSRDGLLAIGPDFRCRRIIAHDYALDFSIIELDGRAGDMFGVLYLTGDNTTSVLESAIVQHPSGWPKKVSVDDCRIELVAVRGLVTDSDFTHTCDTRGGSSGSPVIDQNGRVVALHHLGVSKLEKQFSEVNRAVSASKILAHLAINNVKIEPE